MADDRLSAGVVLDTIGRLVERSMVWVERGRTTRYRMLETLRQYAAEQLAASGEPEAIAAPACGATSETSPSGPRSELRGHGQRETLRLLRDEQPNIRAAHHVAVPARRRHRLGPGDGRFPRMFWHLGRHLEGREVLGRLVDGARRFGTAPGPGPCRRCPSWSGRADAWCTPARAVRRPRRRAFAIFSEPR